MPQHARRKTDFSKSVRLGVNDHIAIWEKPKQKPDWMDDETYHRLPDTIDLFKNKEFSRFLGENPPGRLSAGALRLLHPGARKPGDAFHYYQVHFSVHPEYLPGDTENPQAADNVFDLYTPFSERPVKLFLRFGQRAAPGFLMRGGHAGSADIIPLIFDGIRQPVPVQVKNLSVMGLSLLPEDTIDNIRAVRQGYDPPLPGMAHRLA